MSSLIIDKGLKIVYVNVTWMYEMGSFIVVYVNVTWVPLNNW
jgi:hypothetical protein